MADGRKNNGGHSTKGKAGRKPKSDEEAKLALMRSVLPDEEFMKRVAKKIKEGSETLMKLWFEHLYGKPKERKDINLSGEVKTFDKVFIKPPLEDE